MYVCVFVCVFVCVCCMCALSDFEFRQFGTCKSGNRSLYVYMHIYTYKLSCILCRHIVRKSHFHADQHFKQTGAGLLKIRLCLKNIKLPN